jgi:hypothetical protein
LEKAIEDSAKEQFELRRERAKKQKGVLKDMSPSQGILSELKVALMDEAMGDMRGALRFSPVLPQP